MNTDPFRLPDFYIIGAPKAGTSALYTYLSTHPGIAMSNVKEPFYWSADLGAVSPVRDREAYLQLWPDTPAHRLRGEASTHYLRSAVAIPAILRESPDARFIVMLRSPVEMVQAWHSTLVRYLQEDVGRFEKAWALQDVRGRGRRIPPACPDPQFLQYRRFCAVGEQFERLVARVPAEQRLTILYDDFAADPSGCYRRVLSFLGLVDDGRSDFPKVNANKTRRWTGIDNVQRAIGRSLGPLYAPLRNAAHFVGFHPTTLINRFNVTEAPRRRLAPEFEAELVCSFRPEVEKIEAILGRDLSHWRIAGTADGNQSGPGSHLARRNVTSQSLGYASFGEAGGLR